MKRLVLLTGLIISILSLPVLSHALPVYIANSNFEADYVNEGVQQYSVTGWSIEEGDCWFCRAGVLNAADFMFANGIPEGDNVGFASAGASLYQQLDYVLRPDTQLTLSADVGWRLDAGLPSSSPGYYIGLFAGDTEIASMYDRLGPIGEFSTATVQYIVSDSDPLLGERITIRLSNKHYWNQVSFDNVSLNNDELQREVPSVPEPATLFLITGPVAAFIALRRMRQ